MYEKKERMKRTGKDREMSRVFMPGGFTPKKKVIKK